MVNNYFILTNDSDHGVVSDYEKIYDALNEHGIMKTCAVFVDIVDDGSALAQHCGSHDTHALSNPDYRTLMKYIASCGHEIAFHGASPISNTREEFLKGLDQFSSYLGFAPRTYIEHGGKFGHHSSQMCKKETLAYMGADPSSEFYVKDIVETQFDLIWTHKYLIDGQDYKGPALVSSDGKAKYFNRVRNRDLEQIPDTTTDIIGYTHFGYNGYGKRIDRIFPPFFSPRRYELWNGKANLNRAVTGLKTFATSRNLTFSTLINYYDQHRI